MAKTASDTNTPSASAEQALKRRKKQARREAKLMLEIEKAQKDLKQAQKQQSKAQALLEARSTSLHTLEARLAELRAQSLEPEIGTPPQSAELEHQQEPSELESSIGSSDGQQLASPDLEDQSEITALTDQAVPLPQVEEGIGISSNMSESGTSTSTEAEPTPPIVEEEEATPSEVMVVTDEMTERAAVQDNETATETDPAPTPETPAKAPAQKTAAVRKPAATKRPASQSTATKRPANRSRSRQSPSDPG